MNTRSRQSLIRKGLIICLLASLSLLLGSVARGQERVDRKIRDLVNKLADPDVSVNSKAADTLIISGQLAREAVADLLKLLKDEKQDISARLNAAAVLLAIGPEAREATHELVKLLADDKQDAAIRGRVALVLARIGPDATESIDVLKKSLNDKDEYVVLSAATALGQFGVASKTAIPTLIELSKDKNREALTRSQAIFALMSISEEKELIFTLNELFRDKNEIVQQSAIAALAKTRQGKRTAVYALKDLMNHSDPFIRQWAITTISGIGPEAREAVDELIGRLKDKNENHRVRSVAAYALGGIGPDAGKKAVAVLIESLEDQSIFVRRGAAIALARFGLNVKEIIPALVKRLEDTDIMVRGYAAQSISGLSNDQARTGVTDALDLLKNAYESLSKSQHPEVSVYAGTVKQNIEYLESLNKERGGTWWGQTKQWMQNHPILSAVIALYPALLLVSLAFLWLRPVWLLQINESLLKTSNIALPDWLGGVNLSALRYIMLVGFFHYRPKVLDAWVDRHVEKARKVFSEKNVVEARAVHIPVPVVLDKENIVNLTADNLKPVFSRNLACLLIWGEGGSGKTSLVCLLGKWAMSEDREQRLCREHLMLPILIEQDVEPQIKDNEDAFLNVINSQLRVLIDEAEHPSPELLRQLLKKRRVLVIVDGLSEMSEASRTNILAAITGLPANAVIITARDDEPLNDLPKSAIKPLRIKGNRLATFMEAYLSHRKKRELFEDDEFFEACRRLSLIVGDRDVTALLAKLYAEQLIATKERIITDDLPENVPDLMLSYLNYLNRDAAGGDADDRTVHRTAEALAWACLKESLRPAAASRKNVLAVLGESEQNFSLIKYLEEKLKIVQTIGAGRDRIRFVLDPLSEYLASLHLVNEYGGSREIWRKFLIKVDEQEGAPEAIKGFLLALRDCCLTKGADAQVPGFVTNEIEKRLSLNQETKRKPGAGDGSAELFKPSNFQTPKTARE